MKLLITLDHELFFGNNTGTIGDCLLRPTDKLVNLLDKTNSKAVFFVDAGYLVALKRQKEQFNILENDYNDFVSQIRSLESSGHDIQFHFHPHWEDSFFDGSRWKIDIRRYRPADFSSDEIKVVFNSYFSTLQEICHYKIFAYRAGGWCIQPFDQIHDCMLANNILVDSTIFHGGYDKSESHFFDFRHAPLKDRWEFSDNPVKEQKGGRFIEIPISSHMVSPFFFQRMFLYKLMRKYQEQPDKGTPVYASKKKILKKMLTSTNDVVSIDGLKSDLLMNTFNKFVKNKKEYFVMIGHPKSFDDRTYKNLDKLISYALSNGHEMVTFRELSEKKELNIPTNVDYRN